jgi:hypothetical protein
LLSRTLSDNCREELRSTSYEVFVREFLGGSWFDFAIEIIDFMKAIPAERFDRKLKILIPRQYIDTLHIELSNETSEI